MIKEITITINEHNDGNYTIDVYDSTNLHKMDIGDHNPVDGGIFDGDDLIDAVYEAADIARILINNNNHTKISVNNKK